jgi:hypothetical protein
MVWSGLRARDLVTRRLVELEVVVEPALGPSDDQNLGFVGVAPQDPIGGIAAR